MEKKVYLAGPEVFLPEEENQYIVEKKKSILASLGMVGVDPLDNNINLPEDKTPNEKAMLIYRANKQTMDSCDACIANVSPFRGASGDPGTVFEVGYMVSQGKPVYGFTTMQEDYKDRFNFSGDIDNKGMMVEDFELSDNLMIECSILDNGGKFFRGNSKFFNGSSTHRLWDEKAFRACAEALREKMLEL